MFKRKTLPIKNRERNEKICAQRSGVIVVPIIVEPVVVRIPLIVVEVQITDVEIVIRRIAETYRMPPISPPVEYSPS